MSAPFNALIMAAGKGTRMRSPLPKVLHPVCGRPMVEWVIAAARDAGASDIVCVTRPGDGVAEGLPPGVLISEQKEGEGTGAAVLAARDAIYPGSTVVILSGDHPLLAGDLIGQLLATHESENAAATILTTEELDPAGYGRIVRDGEGAFEEIVETKHTDGVDPAHLAVREVNIGTYAVAADKLFSALDEVDLQHGERYLTGIFPLLRAEGDTVVTHQTRDVSSAVGINDRAGLMEAEELAQRRILIELAREGVTFESPGSTRVDAGVQIGEGTVIAAATTLRGSTKIGAGAVVGPATTITDSTLGDGVSCLHSFLVEATVEEKAKIGPFAYLRPGSRIGIGAKVGTFVETKNTSLGAGAKAPHLSYLGDADIGDGANIAAGNITANYDGFNKYRTEIGERVRTGVNASFIAPVSVGEGAYIGAGSVITEDVPPGALGISRPEQKNVEGYAKRIEDERG